MNSKPNDAKIYSQNNEETVIKKFLDRSGITTGRLLDIGAYHPEAFSNSRALILDGWSAVMVEPSPKPFLALLEAYKGNPNIVLVNAAVCPHNAVVAAFHDSAGDAISTLNVDHRAKWESGWKANYCKFFLHLLPVPVLLDTFGTNFEFVNIDVEGNNLSIFLAMPFATMPKVRVICVEHDNMHEQIAAQAAQYGFKLESINGENIILTR